MWTLYEVELRFKERLMAGIPKNPDLIKDWLAARAPATPPENAKPLDELAAEVAESVEPTMEKMWCGFQGDGDGLYVRGDGQVKAHLKDCANVLKARLSGDAPPRGKAFTKAKFKDRVFVEPDNIPILRDGKPIKAPDGYIERAVNVITALGPRSALKRNDYIDEPELRFCLRVVNDGVVTEDMLRAIFEYGGHHGFLANRSIGEGKYELVSLREA